MTRGTGLLRDKVVMITGASSGIGAAAGRVFAAEGATVVLMARREKQLLELADEIAAVGGRAMVTTADVSRETEVERAVAEAVSRFGRLDAAFNNAGHTAAGGLLHETDPRIFEQVMDVNVRGVWNCMRHQIPAMLCSGGPAAIVNTSSVAGVLAAGPSSAYVAAKHAVLGLTRAAAAEYGRRGVRVNALVVGSTRTEMMDQVLADTPSLEEAFVARSAQKRMAAPEEIAHSAAWLCSDRASFVTGAAMPVDGGWTAV
ncbi:SDR family NAD(P)-dependent oxidoreductase [Streptomyces salinarius]|uniref:SDR family NAD(P)-dependent oxidoreductase n=1 Tax=Streptomyces salinarius TaxID=2762598 RepID=UPI0013DAE93B|nr:glucose 1-dehydrogenase [Streptomyces salinarius]